MRQHQKLDHLVLLGMWIFTSKFPIAQFPASNFRERVSEPYINSDKFGPDLKNFPHKKHFFFCIEDQICYVGWSGLANFNRMKGISVNSVPMDILPKTL